MGKLLRGLTLASAFLSIGLLTGCSVNPVTGQSELSLMSPAQELAVGSKQYGPSQQSQGGRYTVDPNLTAYVNQVGKKLAAVSDRPDLPYEFVVLNNDVPNAWALPGGKIAINRGLLTELKDEAQLAAVLGHEIVHAAARHGAQQMTQGTLLGIGTQVAAVVGQQKTQYGPLVGMGAQLGSTLYQAHYGREQELESDHYGMIYMQRAGYDPKAAVELQQTFVRLSEGKSPGWVDGLFASHPPSMQRVAANQSLANVLGNGSRNETAFNRALKQLNKDQKAYAQHQKAIEAANNEDFGKALKLVDEALKAQPQEPRFHITKGQLLLVEKKAEPALNSFQRAHNLYPEYYLPLLGMGIAQRNLKSFTNAESSLSRSYAIMPTQSAAFYLGEVNMQLGQKRQAMGYFQQASQGGGELGQRAQAYLQQLAGQAQ